MKIFHFKIEVQLKLIVYLKNWTMESESQKVSKILGGSFEF